jgi:hypothetical protein
MATTGSRAICAMVGHERSAEQAVSAERESAILGVWDAREFDHCG